MRLLTRYNTVYCRDLLASMTEQLINIRLGWISLSLALLLLFYSDSGWAQSSSSTDESTPSEQPVLDEFSPNPLNSTEPDPLLPKPPRKGQFLSLTQQQQLAPIVEQLNTEATALLTDGNPVAAFNLWMRELRLRRYFGLLPEITALRRVGGIALNNNQRLYARFITERLEDILQQAQSESQFNPELLQNLGLAFQELAARESAIATYKTLLEQAQKQDKILIEEQALSQIAQVYFSWLDYPKAAESYEELLTLQQQIRLLKKSDQLPQSTPLDQTTETLPPEIQSLEQLAFIYEQMGDFLQAITAREKLVGYYLEQQNLQPIPELKLSIGQSYEQLKQFQQAAQNYQEAYQLSTSFQQYVIASDSLEKLGKLYRGQNQKDAALQLYQAQLLIFQQSYNWVGMMGSYDKIGQIYVEKTAYPQALSAFQQGFQLAQQLKYREDYFAQKIEAVQQKINP